MTTTGSSDAARGDKHSSGSSPRLRVFRYGTGRDLGDICSVRTRSSFSSSSSIDRAELRFVRVRPRGECMCMHILLTVAPAANSDRIYARSYQYIAAIRDHHVHVQTRTHLSRILTSCKYVACFENNYPASFFDLRALHFYARVRSIYIRERTWRAHSIFDRYTRVDRTLRNRRRVRARNRLTRPVRRTRCRPHVFVEFFSSPRRFAVPRVSVSYIRSPELSTSTVSD